MATKAHIEDLRTIRDNALEHRNNSLLFRDKAKDYAGEGICYYLFQGEKDACDRILKVIDDIIQERKITL